MLTKLSGDELTAATLHLVSNYSPHHVGMYATAAILTEFLQPLTTENVKREHVVTMLEHAEDWREADELANDPMEAMDEKAGSWRRHAQKSRRRVQVAATAICEGGVPA